MTQFRKLSIIGGWVVFAIAFVVYMLTLEPTASLWDCPEFIATSYKLEVGHPPGTPLFFLINRIGAMFAGAPENVAYAINTLSALESALTIAFMFWTVAHLARKIFRKTAAELSVNEVWVTMSAAAIGSLAYAFTDTFWFSAVEAEVYALSSLFTAVVFWAMLRWESVADEKGSNRWLVLIAYLMGLSIGAHILNLLTIPALVFVYYFKKFPASPKSHLWKPAAVGIILTGLFYILTPTVISIGAWVDRIFVNGFGFGVNSGMATLIVLILVGLGYWAYRAQKQGSVNLNTVLISVCMIVVGFSTYGVVLIRSAVNPPMNSNHPDNPYALVQFLNREQYGSRPLIQGKTFASPAIEYVDGDSYYIDETGKYKAYSYVKDVDVDPATKVLFPRMYSSDHADQYKAWSPIKGRKVKSITGEMVTVPTFGENLNFFVGYQVNHMYWRYFLWNFVGRQTDLQSDGIANGNWLSGIKPIDAMYLGPQDGLPEELANNKGRNHYYYLPLILGLIGFFFQLKKEGRGFLLVALLFFMTGIAIILYLNQTPSQPRERDYAYAASFYAFALWIGLGVVGVCHFFKTKVFKANAKPAIAVASVVCLSVPVILAAQNWDDHDRSGRTIAHDMGRNYLSNLLPNAVLINYGDNDTFPVWYAQEVLGERLDVRVMNSSYISGDWYADQMRVKSNEGAPLPISLPRSKYKAVSTPLFYVRETAHPMGRAWTASEVMQVVNSEDRSTKVFSERGEAFDFIPSRRIAVPVNKENVLKSGIVKPEDTHLIVDTMWINLRKDAVSLGDMVLIDMIATSDWTRPIYFTSQSSALDLGLTATGSGGGEAYTYTQMDGVVYRLVPIKTPINKRFEIGRVDGDLLYDNLMNKYSYGGVKNGVYVDQFVNNVLTQSQFRTAFARLADEMTARGDTVRAVEVLDRAMLEMPIEQFRRDEALTRIIESYWRAGQIEKGDAMADDYFDTMIDYLDYYARFKGNKALQVEEYMMQVYNNLYYLYSSAGAVGRTKYTDKLRPYFEK